MEHIAEISAIILATMAVLTFVFQYVFRNSKSSSEHARQRKYPQLKGVQRSARTKKRQITNLSQAPLNIDFFGREDDLRLLNKLILGQSVNLIMIQGFGGVGKSTLIARCARDLQNKFDICIFKKFTSPWPLAMVMSEILEQLEVPISDEEMDCQKLSSLLLEELKPLKSLIVFDNIETVIGKSGKDAGVDNEYDIFLAQWSSATSNSTLILTGRQSPTFIRNNEGEKKSTRLIRLSGLQLPAAKNLMLSIAPLHGSSDDWKSVYEIYQGNALALELISRHIRDVFAGELRIFLQSGKAIVGDIESLITWHVERLKEPELGLMFWLAIYREPVSIETLSAAIIEYEIKDNLHSLVQTLNTKIPLEKTHLQFSLQPVLMEHMTEKLIRSIDGAIYVGSSDILEKVTNKLITQASAEIEQQSRLTILRRISLRRLDAKGHIQDAQIRSIIKPILNRLTERFVNANRVAQVLFGLISLARSPTASSDYLASNIINLMREIRLDLSDFDFSNLCLRGADLTDLKLHRTSFRSSVFVGCIFTFPLGSPFRLLFINNTDIVVVGDSNGDITFVNVKTNEFLRRIDAHKIHIRALAYDPTRHEIISGSEDRSLRFWNADTGNLVTEVIIHSNWINDVVMLGDKVISASEDQSIAVCDRESNRILKHFRMPETPLTRLCVNQDTQMLFGADCSGNIWEIDIFYPSEPRKLVSLGEWITAIAINTSATRLVAGSAFGVIYVIDIGEANLMVRLDGHDHGVESVSFMRNEDAFLSVGGDGVVKFWNTNELQSMRILQRSATRIRDVAISDNDEFVSVCAEDQRIHTWTLQNGKFHGSLRGLVDGIICFAVDCDGHRAVTGGDNGVIRAWDLREGKQIKETIIPQYRFWAVAMTTDGNLMATGGVDQKLRIWRTESLECVRIFDRQRSWIKAVVISANGERIISASMDGRAICVDTHNLDIEWEKDFERRQFFGAGITDDGKVVALCDASGDVILLNGKTGESLRTVCHHDGRARHVVFSGSGQIMYCCSEDCTISEVDVKTGKLLRRFGPTSGMIWFIDISHETNRLVSCDESNVVNLWDICSGNSIRQYLGHTSRVYNVRFCARGSQIVTAGEDRRLIVWCGETGRKLVEMSYPKLYQDADFRDVTGLSDAQLWQISSLGGYISQS